MFSHGWKEMDYHPDIYKKRKCHNGDYCQRNKKNCPFWHTNSDRIMDIK